ncbi:MAG TPA: hypothetical protein PKK12_13010, partial [Candidatus Aminicenantes bacterium]|nr:hypothetical protein [Candidatus Aminicenantes bacterium]
MSLSRRRIIAGLALLALTLASVRPLRFTWHLLAGSYCESYWGREEVAAVVHYAQLIELRKGLALPETPAFRDAESLVAIRGYLRAGVAGRRKLAGAATAMLVHHPANLYLTHLAGQRGGAPAADVLLAAGFTDPSLNAFTLEAIAHSGPGGNSRGDWLADLAGFARWQGNPGLAGQIAALPGATPLSAEAPRVPLLSRNADWAGLLGWLRARKGEGMTVLSPPPLS